MTSYAIICGEPLRVTQAAANSQLVGPKLIGMSCNGSTSGTITITDSPPSGARTVINAMPLVAGNWYPLPFRLVGQVTITIAGTGDVTVSYSPN